jgi:hypothetical protein
MTFLVNEYQFASFYEIGVILICLAIMLAMLLGLVLDALGVDLVCIFMGLAGDLGAILWLTLNVFAWVFGQETQPPCPRAFQKVF